MFYPVIVLFIAVVIMIFLLAFHRAEVRDNFPRHASTESRCRR